MTYQSSCQVSCEEKTPCGTEKQSYDGCYGGDHGGHGGINVLSNDFNHSFNGNFSHDLNGNNLFSIVGY